MVKEKVLVKNKSGIHLRPATELSKIAGKLKSKITIYANDKTIDPKSLLILMSAGIKQGTEIEIECDGDSEIDDLNELIEAIESGLGEE